MKPMVRDEAASRPKLRADDAARSRRDEWKLLRKQVADVAKIQAARLEQAMVTQRRWSARTSSAASCATRSSATSRSCSCGAAGQATTFRVTEELDYADADDEPVTLDGEIGIVHPLQLSDAERAAWGEQLADYEIVPPFPQLGRPVLDVLEQASAARSTSPASSTARSRPPRSCGCSRTLGWQRGTPQDGGIFYLHAKPFPSIGVTAVVEYDGVPVGYMVDWDDQSISGRTSWTASSRRTRWTSARAGRKGDKRLKLARRGSDRASARCWPTSPTIMEKAQVSRRRGSARRPRICTPTSSRG